MVVCIGRLFAWLVAGSFLPNFCLSQHHFDSVLIMAMALALGTVIVVIAILMLRKASCADKLFQL